ncbi:transposable element Tcb1 transposase [Trichonephila clavipes]|nr:transposable element Tcb1 transposase [Trichonephila clavipes]
MIGRLECGRTQLEVSEERITPCIISGFGNDSKMMDGSFGEGIILGSRTDLHVYSVTMTSHIYRDVILEKHVNFFVSGTMNAEFMFMDDNARVIDANIVD